MKKKSILLNEDIHKRIKIYCAEKGCQMKKWVEEQLVKSMEKGDEIQENRKID